MTGDESADSGAEVVSMRAWTGDEDDAVPVLGCGREELASRRRRSIRRWKGSLQKVVSWGHVGARCSEALQTKQARAGVEASAARSKASSGSGTVT